MCVVVCRLCLMVALRSVVLCRCLLCSLFAARCVLCAVVCFVCGLLLVVVLL